MLRERLAANVPVAVTQVVSGLGGIGKTQLVNEYAWRCRSGQEGYPPYSAIFWVNAATEDALNASYDHIAELLGRKSEKIAESVQNVRAYLENETNQGYLLLYDNADTPSLLDAYLPSPLHGHVLITSRADEGHVLIGEQAFEVLPLDNLPEEEAVTFLLDRARTAPDRKTEDGKQAARELTRALFGFPLALEQAAAYMVVHREPIRDYLERYREAEQAGQELEELDSAEPETGNYRDAENNRKTVRTTWRLNFDAVKQECPEAAQLLEFAAFLAPDAIPMELIVRGAEEIPEPLRAKFLAGQSEAKHKKAWNALLTALAHYSLVTRNADRTFLLHRMVRSVLRAGLTSEQRETLSTQAEHAVARVFRSTEFAHWSVCERVLPHARPIVEQATRTNSGSKKTTLLLNQIGLYLHYRGQYTDARRYYETALTIYRTVLPEGHPTIAVSLNNLAGVYYYQGRYDEAEPLLQQALIISQNALPQGHPTIATRLHNLAGLYQSQGRYSEAEPLIQQALIIDRKALGENHPNYASDLNNLADLYGKLGRYAEAERLFQQALAILRTAFQEGHPNIGIILNNMAALYSSQGRDTEAEPLYSEAMEIIRCAIGEHQPTTRTIAQAYDIFLKEKQQFDAEKQETGETA